ncbi:MAG: hypothetical protein GEV08_20100 [Acidimicrobiia bacterium]|nr:hypothetical protein [Acidimicrobiia bacterium]
MLACWSAKGGSGTTVVAAALACALATTSPGGSLLADLAGDADAVLGCPPPAGGGLAAWLSSPAAPDATSLGRAEVDAGGGVRLLPRGHGALDSRHGALLAALLEADGRPVVVDCGTLGPGEAPPEVAAELAGGASRSLLVLRPCFLALRHAVMTPLRPAGVVLLAEPGRALTARDVAAVLGVPVLCEVPVEPGVARAVDAGLLASRLPRSLSRALRPLAEAA